MFLLSVTAALILAAAGAEAERYPEYLIKTEFRRDYVDYDASEKEYFRSLVKLNLSEDSHFSAGYADVPSEADRTWAGSLYLGDALPGFEIALGGYTVSSGTGLILGKRSFFSADAFSPRRRAGRSAVIAAPATANPLYLMAGAAAGISFGTDENRIALYPFISCRRRYFPGGDFDSGRTTVSISGINTKLNPSEKYTEPVMLLDSGIVLALLYLKNFSIQLCFLRGGVFDYTMRKMQVGSGDGSAAHWGYGGESLFAGYSDKTFTAWFEAGCAFRLQESGAAGRSDSLGFSGGLVISPGFYTLSVSGEGMRQGFFAPVSSDPGAPSARYEGALLLKLSRKLNAGLSSSAEVNNSASGQSAYLRSAHREEAFLERKSESFSAKMKYVHLVTDGDGLAVSHQFKLSGSALFRRGLSVLMSSSLQKRRGAEAAWSAGCALKWTEPELVRMRFDYIRVEASAHNPVFLNPAPFAGSVSTGSMFRKALNINAILIVLEANSSLSCNLRAELVYSSKGVYDRRFDAGASCNF